MDKKKIVKNVVIISIIVVIIGILVVSYAMFFNTGTSNNSTKLGNLDVEYIDGGELTIDNLLPINNDEVEEKSSVFNFSVENKGNSYSYYDIKLVDIDLPLALKDENFKWKLLSNDELINEGNFHELANTKDYLKRSIGIDSKEVKKYKLQLWIENSNNVDQSYMLNRSGNFKIQIEARQKLAKSPKDEITVISNTTNGNLEDLKIYGNTTDGKNVGDNKTINITVSQNLVDNGLGELGNNTNFSQLAYNDEKYKSLGSFNKISDRREEIKVNNISIINNYYYMNICSKNNGTDAIYIFGTYDYDIDDKEIYQRNTYYANNTITYLTKDLNDGDEYIYLNDISNYDLGTKGLIFWNYTDSTGYTYPIGTYSQNAWLNMYITENVDKENNRIKLNEPWDHGTIKKGTYISRKSTYGGFNPNPLLSYNKQLSTEYTCYNKIIQGISPIDEIEKNYDIYNKFRRGIKYAKILIFDNQNNIPNTETYYSRIILRKNENIQNITIDISGHDPLRSVDDTRDYIDYKNKRIVRLINTDGSIKSSAEYEPITLPEIKTYDGNTIIESNDESSPLFQAEY